MISGKGIVFVLLLGFTAILVIGASNGSSDARYTIVGAKMGSSDYPILLDTTTGDTWILLKYTHGWVRLDRSMKIIYKADGGESQ
jgi:hypothetical protein